MPKHLSDPADALLARTDNLEIHTQHQLALDSAPDFYGSQEDEEALFSGLSGKAGRKVKLPKAAGVQQVHPGGRGGAPMHRIAPRPAQRMGGFMPGMGDLGDVASATAKRPPQPRVLSRGLNRSRPIAAMKKGYAGFIPGMGDLDGPLPSSATAKRSPQPRVLSRGINRSRPIAPMKRGYAGFIPGMGDFTVAGMGIGTLALVGVGAWFLLRKKR